MPLPPLPPPPPLPPLAILPVWTWAPVRSASATAATCMGPVFAQRCRRLPSPCPAPPLLPCPSDARIITIRSENERGGGGCQSTGVVGRHSPSLSPSLLPPLACLPTSQRIPVSLAAVPPRKWQRASAQSQASSDVVKPSAEASFQGVCRPPPEAMMTPHMNVYMTYEHEWPGSESLLLLNAVLVTCNPFEGCSVRKLTEE